MKFSVLFLVGHAPHPLTGELPSAAERFTEVLETAAAAERLGFDAYAIGERHAGPFLSSSPGVVLGAPAARTSTIRLPTGVTVVAILDSGAGTALVGSHGWVDVGVPAATVPAAGEEPPKHTSGTGSGTRASRASSTARCSPLRVTVPPSHRSRTISRNSPVRAWRASLSRKSP